MAASREHAPWALTQFGFRAVVSTSIADIFRQNSLKNSLVPVIVPRDVHAELFALAENATVTIDLASQTLRLPNGRAVEFPIDAFSKHCLLNGIDELGYIQQQDAAIAAYEAGRQVPVNTLGSGRGQDVPKLTDAITTSTRASKPRHSPQIPAVHLH